MSQGYFLMLMRQFGVVFSLESRNLIPLDERFHYQSRCSVLNQERFTVAINRDFKAVLSWNNLISPELQQFTGNSTGQAGLIVLKLGRATNWLGNF